MIDITTNTLLHRDRARASPKPMTTDEAIGQAAKLGRSSVELPNPGGGRIERLKDAGYRVKFHTRRGTVTIYWG